MGRYVFSVRLRFSSGLARHVLNVVSHILNAAAKSQNILLLNHKWLLEIDLYDAVD